MSSNSLKLGLLLGLHPNHFPRDCPCQHCCCSCHNYKLPHLDDFIYNSLLNQVRKWNTTITKNDEDKFYLVKRVEFKQISIELSTSTDNVRTIKETMKYFNIINKEYLIHIVIERIKLEQLKEKLFDEDPINIKKKRSRRRRILNLFLVRNLHRNEFSNSRDLLQRSRRLLRLNLIKEVIQVRTTPSINLLRNWIRNLKRLMLFFSPQLQKRRRKERRRI